MFSVGQRVWHRDGQRSGVVLECDGDQVFIAQDNGAELDFRASDLTATPPAVSDTVTVGKQPSGLAIARKGDLALVANRAGRSVSVLSIAGAKAATGEESLPAENAPGADGRMIGRERLEGAGGHLSAM